MAGFESIAGSNSNNEVTYPQATVQSNLQTEGYAVPQSTQVASTDGTNTNGQWRAGYGQVAPIFPGQGDTTGESTTGTGTGTGTGSFTGTFGDASGTAPQYNATTIGDTAPSQPMATPSTSGDGSGNTGTAYNPGATSETSSTSSSSGGWPTGGDSSGNAPASNTSTGGDSSGISGAAYNPNADVPSAPAKGSEQQSAVSTAIPETPKDSVGFLPATVMGGLGGIIGGSFAPKHLNKLAASITDGSAAADGTAKPGFFDEGGIGGKFFGKSRIDSASTKLGSIGKNFKVENLPNNAAVGWQNNFQPQYAARPDLQKLLDGNAAYLKTAEESEAAGTAPDAETVAKIDAVKAQQNVLGVQGAEGKLDLNPTLFTADGKEALNGLGDNMTSGLGTDSALAKQVENLGRAYPDGGAALETAAKPAFMDQPAVREAGKGAAMLGGTILADHLVGGVLGSNNGALHLDTVAIPAAFLMGDSLQQKAVYGAAAVIGSNVIDKIMPASSHPTISRIFNPDGMDALTMGAAFTLPAESPQMRTGMVAGAWAFGRLRNMTGTEATITSGLGLGLTGYALKAGKIDPELGAGLVALEGGGYVLSRILHKV